MIDKPLVTVSGKKILFKSNLHQRLSQDIPQEGVEWRRRLDSNTKSVYIDVDFVDFDIDNVERSSERLARLALKTNIATKVTYNNVSIPSRQIEAGDSITSIEGNASRNDSQQDESDTLEKDSIGTTLDSIQINIEEEPKVIPDTFEGESIISHDNSDKMKQQNIQSERISSKTQQEEYEQQQQKDISEAFFNQKLLGRPILHTYWADKTDFEGDNQKSQFDDWIGQVQASSCTEWAIIIIEDGDFKAQLGTALFKSKLQSTASQANASSSSISSMTQATSSTTSFLDRMKKSLSTMFQSDSNSDRWLTLINQERVQDNKVQESYANFLKKFRNLIMASFSKQIELFEEQLRVQRELRTDKSWNFFSYFSMQEELASAFEFLTLFDEALVQYDLLDALYTEYISSSSFNNKDEPLYKQWTSFESWQGLCLDMNSLHSQDLRQRIVDKKASLLDLRNYLFAKQCDLMLMQNQPWRVAASASIFLQNCLREHELLKINVVPGALTCWTFISALEVLQKCECYSCTSTMENYSLHTVDIWNCARKKLLELGYLVHKIPSIGGNKIEKLSANYNDQQNINEHISKLLTGLGPDPHGGLSYQNNEISPQARLRDALAGEKQFSKHLIEISELTLGTYKHIGRMRHALLVGKELADFYIAQNNFTRALPFLSDMEKILKHENWEPLLEDIQQSILKCNNIVNQDNIKNEVNSNSET